MHTSKTGVPVPEIIGYNLKVKQSETMRVNQLHLLTIAQILLVLLIFISIRINNANITMLLQARTSWVSPQWFLQN